MNKALNTAVFFAAATMFSLGMMITTILSAVIFIQWLRANVGLGDAAVGPLLLVMSLGGLVGTFFLYGRVIKWVDRKIDFSSKIYPLFQRRRP